ncbi:S16 family serine protease [Streptomyces albus]|uniref:S16 family serine protease n=1 Tax=Streptomyces albus TaxID=1888 RepID=UPI0004C5F5A2|nr:S16 family serine protease [Streptomyces albus]
MPVALTRRSRVLAACAVPVAALLGVAAFAPLPFSLAEPGLTADVLGAKKGEQVITISGAEPRKTSGELRMTTIAATGPDAAVGLDDVVDGWFRADRAVMPRDSVYPVGENTDEIEEHNRAEMRESQDTATAAALGYLGRSPKDVKVTLRLSDVGGPSAGLLFALGIVDKLDGDGRGGDLTGGRTIAGTGTITADGRVGPVGGVPLKTRAAKRDGATVFLVPAEECGDARAELPKGLRLIPVTSLEGAVKALTALERGGRVPHC